MVVASRHLVLVERREDSLADRLGIKEFLFRLGPVTPEHRVGLREGHRGGHPLLQHGMFDGSGAARMCLGAAHLANLRQPLLVALRILSIKGLLLVASVSAPPRSPTPRIAGESFQGDRTVGTVHGKIEGHLAVDDNVPPFKPQLCLFGESVVEEGLSLPKINCIF
jgi:hypothetical protein